MSKYKASELRIFCQTILIQEGMSTEHAEVVSDSLLKASLQGIDSHGISRLPIYLKRFADKRINISPSILVEESGASVLVVKGDNGLGHVVAHQAIEKGIDMARKTGTVSIAIRNSNHFGTVSYFCELACNHNLACIGFTNSPSGIAPWGGKNAFFGTNPIAFGFPTGNDTPVIIDLSTSVVARGKIISAAKQGTKIPDNWAMDENGLSTIEPEAALKGSVLPLGGAKGAAIALAVEILTGVLTGAVPSSQVKNIYEDNETENANVGHFFILIDIVKFMNLEVFYTLIQDLLEEMRSIPKIQENGEIRYPGERRKKEETIRNSGGIEITGNIEEELITLSKKFNIPFPKPIRYSVNSL